LASTFPAIVDQAKSASMTLESFGVPALKTVGRGHPSGMAAPSAVANCPSTTPIVTPSLVPS